MRRLSLADGFLLGLPVVFLAALGIATRLRAVPPWVSLGYLAVSAGTLGFYGWDKWRARREEWRVSEATLHCLELVGGWPGALLAQRLFRHKTRKVSFQIVFWLIVVGHLALWSWFAVRR